MLSAAWGLIGLISPETRKILLIGLAVLAAVVVIDRRATYRERAKCQAAALQSQLDAANRDLTALRNSIAREREAVARLERQTEQYDAENQKLREEVAKLPVEQQCRFGTRAKEGRR